jgi:hypothetical protein
MTKKLLLGTAIAALTLSGAWAQTTPSPTTPSASPPAAADKSDQAKPKMDEANKAGATKDASGKADFVMSQQPDQLLASNFTGTDVIGSDNKKIGDVSDVLFDKNGKILAYVVSVGGFLGMGAKDVALPPSAFQVESGTNGGAEKLKVSLSENELKQAQNFKPYAPPRATTTGASPRPLSSPSGGMSPSSGR